MNNNNHGNRKLGGMGWEPERWFAPNTRTRPCSNSPDLKRHQL